MNGLSCINGLPLSLMRHWRYIPLLFLLLMTGCTLFQPSRIGYRSAETIGKRIDSISSEQHIRSVTRSAMEGALEGTNSSASDSSIDSLSKRLADVIHKELNRVFQNLDTKTPGKKFSRGVVENLIGEEVKQELKLFLKSTSQEAEADLSIAIAGLEKSLSKSINNVFSGLDRQLSGMDESIGQVLSETLRDSLTSFINESIAQLELEPLSHKLSTELLSKELRDSIISLATDVQQNIDITEPFPDILRAIRHNAYLFAIFSFGIIAFLIFWSYKLRNRRLLGDDFTEVIYNLDSSEDRILKQRLEQFLKEKGHYEFYRREVNKINKKK